MRALIDKRVCVSLPTDERNRISKEHHAFRAARRKFSGRERGVPIVAKTNPGLFVGRNDLGYISSQRAFLLVTALAVRASLT